MDERNRQQMILQMIRKEKIVAIVRGIPSGLILDTGRALADGGICMMEVTFDHSGPEGIRETLHSIALLKEHLSERMHIGAGTVLTAEEAEERTIQMLNVYADFCEQVLAIPVVKGQKTDKEKFAGAEATYTIESLMHDGKALQSGTSHNFGDGFAKAFGIQYTDKENKLQYVHQTSWGMTTRMIGAIIMVHGDDNGLVLPPRIAPVQIMVVPIQQKKEGVLDKAFELRDRLVKSGYAVKVDDTDKSPGWKFADCEMRGIPLRVEIGPKDMEQNQAVLVRRDTHEKTVVCLDELEAKAGELLETIQKDMLEKARAHREAHTYTATEWDEFVDTINNKPGFVKAMWCGCQECEDKIKELTGATSRCMPFKQEKLSDTCICCGKPAAKMVYWGRAY